MRTCEVVAAQNQVQAFAGNSGATGRKPAEAVMKGRTARVTELLRAAPGVVLEFAAAALRLFFRRPASLLDDHPEYYNQAHGYW